MIAMLEKMRLDKFLADNANLSRKQARIEIFKGNVIVNQNIVQDIAFKLNINDSVLFNGNIYNFGNKFSYYILNKPPELLTAAIDKSQPTIMSLLPSSFIKNKIMPVGRLDKDTSGIILLTNDGKLAHRLLSPKWKVYKLYYVILDKEMDSSLIEKFKEGVQLSDFKCQPAILSYLDSQDKKHVSLKIFEGKFHQVKRMFAAYGLEVIKLHRQSFADIQCDINESQYRQLSQMEVDKLYSLSQLSVRNE